MPTWTKHKLLCLRGRTINCLCTPLFGIHILYLFHLHTSTSCQFNTGNFKNQIIFKNQVIMWCANWFILRSDIKDQYWGIKLKIQQLIRVEITKMLINLHLYKTIVEFVWYLLCLCVQDDSRTLCLSCKWRSWLLICFL